MNNRKLIKTLKRERRKLYPYGMPIQPRGCSKTYLYLAHFLRYIAYDFMINEYKNMDEEVTLEKAHNDMDCFIDEMWKMIEDFKR